MRSKSITKYPKIYLGFILYYLMSFLLMHNSIGQSKSNNSLDSNNFDILRMQIELFSSYIKLSNTQLNLLSEADSLGLKGEYEIGLIYLEEILEELNQSNKITDSKEIGDPNNQIHKNIETDNYSLSLVTGIDFDRHEFEYTYETSDSTILEELNKPYIGFSSDFNLLQSQNNKIDLYNSLRYDNENLRDNYQLSFLYKNLTLKYGGYLNKSYEAEFSSYWENNFQINYKIEMSTNSGLYLRNVYKYKSYDKSDLNYTDFYRNLFEATLTHKYLDYDLFAKYDNEMNEYLGNSNYDYKQHKFETGYRYLGSRSLQHSASFDFENRNYEILYGDSTISNNYKQLDAVLSIKINIYKSFTLQLENQFLKKFYKQQSTFEPNYIWNYFKPGIEFEIFSSLQYGLGYEWETKLHSLVEYEDFSSTDQDYNSNGIISSLNYLAMTNLSFSFTISYQWRKYPKSAVNDFINLYSTRNILSLIAVGNLALTNELNLNILTVYDNDKDIDNDQGNTQSSIFNIELEYKF